MLNIIGYLLGTDFEWFFSDYNVQDFFLLHWNPFIRWRIIRRFKDGPQKGCIQTKMYRLYRKMTIYSHFCLDTSQLLTNSFHFGSQQSCYKEVMVYLFSAIPFKPWSNKYYCYKNVYFWITCTKFYANNQFFFFQMKFLIWHHKLL